MASVLSEEFKGHRRKADDWDQWQQNKTLSCWIVSGQRCQWFIKNSWFLGVYIMPLNTWCKHKSPFNWESDGFGKSVLNNIYSMSGLYSFYFIKCLVCHIVRFLHSRHLSLNANCWCKLKTFAFGNKLFLWQELHLTVYLFVLYKNTLNVDKMWEVHFFKCINIIKLRIQVCILFRFILRVGVQIWPTMQPWGLSILM